MILALLEHIDGWKRQSVRTWEGPCPKCGGTKRCIAWIDQDLFKCRECDYKGDIITWLRDQNGLTCQQAHEQAGKQCDNTTCKAWEKCRGITSAPKQTSATTAHVPAAPRQAPQGSPAVQPEALWQQHADKLVAWAHEQLMNDKEQRDYLEQRGLDHGAIVHYRLGWIPRDTYRPRASWGLPDETKPDGKLKKLWIPQGIVIPYPSSGPTHRIRIRRPVVTGSETRYYWLPGSGNDTLTINNGKKAAIIVESDLDALLIDHLAGDIITVISLGTCSARPKPATTDLLRDCAIILIALDNDAAGAGQMKWWRENYPQAERWPVIGGKDPGESYQQGTDLRQWIISGLPISMHPAQKIVGTAAATGEGGAPETPAVTSVVKHDKQGRPYTITNERGEYHRLQANGEAVFSVKEMEMAINAVNISGDDGGKLADMIMEVKQVFSGSYLSKVEDLRGI